MRNDFVLSGILTGAVREEPLGGGTGRLGDLIRLVGTRRSVCQNGRLSSSYATRALAARRFFLVILLFLVFFLIETFARDLNGTFAI